MHNAPSENSMKNMNTGEIMESILTDEDPKPEKSMENLQTRLVYVDIDKGRKDGQVKETQSNTQSNIESAKNTLSIKICHGGEQPNEDHLDD